MSCDALYGWRSENCQYPYWTFQSGRLHIKLHTKHLILFTPSRPVMQNTASQYSLHGESRNNYTLKNEHFFADLFINGTRQAHALFIGFIRRNQISTAGVVLNANSYPSYWVIHGLDQHQNVTCLPKMVYSVSQENRKFNRISGFRHAVVHIV